MVDGSSHDVSKGVIDILLHQILDKISLAEEMLLLMGNPDHTISKSYNLELIAVHSWQWAPPAPHKISDILSSIMVRRNVTFTSPLESRILSCAI